MFNNSLDNILKAFTVTQSRLDAFAAKQDVQAELQAATARLAAERENTARANSEKARRISGNITNMIGA